MPNRNEPFGGEWWDVYFPSSFIRVDDHNMRAIETAIDRHHGTVWVEDIHGAKVLVVVDQVTMIGSSDADSRESRNALEAILEAEAGDSDDDDDADAWKRPK